MSDCWKDSRNLFHRNIKMNSSRDINMDPYHYSLNRFKAVGAVVDAAEPFTTTEQLSSFDERETELFYAGQHSTGIDALTIEKEYAKIVSVMERLVQLKFDVPKGMDVLHYFLVDTVTKYFNEACGNEENLYNALMDVMECISSIYREAVLSLHEEYL